MVVAFIIMIESSVAREAGHFLDELSNCRLFRKSPVLWSRFISVYREDVTYIVSRSIVHFFWAQVITKKPVSAERCFLKNAFSCGAEFICLSPSIYDLPFPFSSSPSHLILLLRLLCFLHFLNMSFLPPSKSHILPLFFFTFTFLLLLFFFFSAPFFPFLSSFVLLYTYFIFIFTFFPFIPPSLLALPFLHLSLPRF
jgi:hypothetical protein